MIPLKSIEPEYEPYINIVWQVSDLCNFRCSYCNESNWGGRRRNRDFTAFREPLMKLFNHYVGLGYQHFKIFFSGGEPTYWEPLIPVVELAQESLPKVRLAINTNLSRDLAWWAQNYTFFDDVIASFHIESANPDKFFENYLFLSRKVNYLVARMMMHEKRFHEVVAFSQRLLQEAPALRLEYVPLFRELSERAEPWEYTNPEHQAFFASHSWVEKVPVPVRSRSSALTSSVQVSLDGQRQSLNSNRLVVERQNFFSGWTCSVHESLFINAGGDISFATCGQSSVRGNLLTGDLPLLSQPIICRKKQCHCGTDICITKKKAHA